MEYVLPSPEFTPIKLSSSPDIKDYIRQVSSYEFQWTQKGRQIIIDTWVDWYKETSPGVYELASVKGLVGYPKKLVASDNWVDPKTGGIWTPEQVLAHKIIVDLINDYPKKKAGYDSLKAEYDKKKFEYDEWIKEHPESTTVSVPELPDVVPDPPAPPTVFPMLEYDFYVAVFGGKPQNVPLVIESVILARDVEGKFN